MVQGSLGGVKYDRQEIRHGGQSGSETNCACSLNCSRPADCGEVWRGGSEINQLALISCWADKLYSMHNLAALFGGNFLKRRSVHPAIGLHPQEKKRLNKAESRSTT